MNTTDMRKFYEDSLNHVADSLLGIKKKDLKRKVLSANNQEDLQKVLDSFSLRFRLRGHDEGCCGSLFQFWNNFDKCNKFYLADGIKPGAPSDTNLDPLFGEHNVIIYQVGQLMCMVSRGLDSVECGNKKTKYHALLYPCFNSHAAKNMRFQPYMEAYLEDGLASSIYMFPAEFTGIRKAYHEKFFDDNGQEMRIIPTDILDKEPTDNSINFTQVTLKMMIAMLADLEYIAYVYNRRNTLTRSNGKARKQYEQHKVHVVHEDVSEDRIVPLHVYTKEYEPSIHGESKGGHHASPVEHDRRSHYRKSRGRGDYELVDGKMVYVGDMKGHYSLVNSTHVNGKKKSIIYKV